MKLPRLLRILPVLLLSVCLTGFAQKKVHPYLVPAYGPNQGFKHFITKTPWIFQAGGNVVDDDGKPFSKVFDAKNSWHVFPSAKLAIEKEFRYNWDVELALSYNSLNSGKRINNKINPSTGVLFSVDLNGKKIITRLYRVEPYVFSGFGYTLRTVSNYKHTATLNAGFGFHIWAIDQILGINIQGCGKFGLTAPIFRSGSNYLQHSLGIIYKFSGNNKRLKAARQHLKSIYNR